MVTHQDIARAVGVSQATVSKVLSNKANFIGVSAKTRQSVIDAAIKLGYNKDKVAATMIQLVEKSIAILVEHIANPFTGVTMHGIEQELAKSDYHFMFASSNGRPEVSVRMIEMLTRRYTTGFVLMPFYESDTSQNVRRFLQMRGIPFVQTNYYNLPGELVSPLVCTNNYDIFKKLCQHLIALGHERIALFHSQPNYSSVAERISAYQDAMSEAGLPVAKSMMVEVPRAKYYDLYIKRQTIKQWMARRHKPTAIMTIKDECAIQFIQLLESMSLRVPDDIAVTGFDDVQHFVPRYYHETYQILTTVRQNLPEIGRQAVRRLIADIEQPERGAGQPRIIIVPAELIIRGSCGARISGTRAEPTLELHGLGQAQHTL